MGERFGCRVVAQLSRPADTLASSFILGPARSLQRRGMQRIQYRSGIAIQWSTLWRPQSLLSAWSSSSVSRQKYTLPETICCEAIAGFCLTSPGRPNKVARCILVYGLYNYFKHFLPQSSLRVDNQPYLMRHAARSPTTAGLAELRRIGRAICWTNVKV